MPLIDRDDILPGPLSDNEKSFPGVYEGELQEEVTSEENEVTDSKKENNIDLATDAYKKIMNVAFYDPATEDVEESEMLDEIPKED